ncbi:DUF2851 family protein [Ferruginibacter lapsinanis]|uniref:DUF2851 family protein n=1 Tax=Ferruginibacter lapsinanis TaxID=563172 RepID=UPI001E446450|nr:DUF2851 family protein [Ferruginibacter lapsinanis]UEG49311.1 DUF2851 family protein [Ferruginibacter lapsinanis]
MTEKLLQYIWQFQYFNKSDLTTTTGEELQIIYPGKLNPNQGPDFLDAKIKVGNTIWAGNIELHIHTADWNDHQHSDDANYRNIILHVVWQDDVQLNEPFFTVELQDRTSVLLLERYTALMNAETFIPCEKNIQSVNPLIWNSWKERLLIERLQHKSTNILSFLSQNNNHWEESFWWLLARNFGVKVNADAFEAIARSIPINILAKHKNQIHQTEALLLGQAGLLNTDCTDDYTLMLKREYQFYKNKYKLDPINIPLHFLRMRPSNFPSVRLAQLAMLIHSSTHLFSRIKEIKVLNDIQALLDVTANDYWHYHYMLDEPSAYKEKKLGTQMIHNICINTIVPVLFAYGHTIDEQEYKNRALQWLEHIPAEKNAITNGYMKLGIANKSAADSQALIQLKNEYCSKKRCLDCAIGNKLLKSSI